VLLGRIPAGSRLGGQLELHSGALAGAFVALATDLGIEGESAAETAAAGVIAVANASMERALRVVSVERGHDPAAYALFCFGGAGGLHACDLALSLNIATVIVPAYAGVFSALGMLFADQIEDLSQTVLGMKLDAAAEAFADLATRLEHQPEGQARLERELELRYAGQSFEITVAWNGDLQASLDAFHAAHERLHGYSRPDAPVELVTLRLRRIVPAQAPELPLIRRPESAPVPQRLNVWLDGWCELDAWQRAELGPGQELAGPALVLEATATLLIRPEFRATVDVYGNLILTKSV
ncbi:MAG TPA: hydantoinase/oxoprolinase family protein, partial [Candidatus Obscuribacterales bacterium]